jgi:predicted DNA-binding protein (UPF0251 family)
VVTAVNLWIDITSNDTVTLHRPNTRGKGYQDARIVLNEQEAVRLADYLNMWLGRRTDSINRQMVDQ